jgi:two-component system NtrC family sensor kinase
MLVEDSPTQAARLRRFFEADELQVVHFTSAEIALDRLEATSPDVIVLDYHLPGMNGNDFCREIRMNVNTRAIPVLMLTSEESDAAQMQGLESGADDYVVKSADPDILRVRVQALLRKSEGASAIVAVENRFSRARLLAIDDSPTYLHYVEQELKKEHYQVETIEDPAKALTRLDETTFDCVLVDFEMGGIDGAEVCRRIRQRHREPETEIVLIMLTSHEDKTRMTAGFNAGADDYISKSADMAVTKARIRALLRRKFLVEENRRIVDEIREKELDAVRARAEREAAELRATMADQLAAANRELDRANQELEHFAYSAAHDLREPLRSISMFSEMLQRKYKGRLDPEADAFIGYSVQGVKRMDELINNLLAYARASQTGDSSTEPVDLNKVCEKVLDHLKTAVEEAHAMVESEPLPNLYIEEIRLQQLFQNLIGNAIKYRRPDAAPHIRISAIKRGDEWMFSVADNGMGIDPAYRAKVFDSFQRLHQTSSPGTGLGLAICRKIVENLGGKIWVDSEPGKGSIFQFTIPARFSCSA